MDKLVVKVIEAKKGLDTFYSIKGFLVAYHLNLFRVNFNSFCANNKPKVLYLFYSQFIFLNINL